MKSAVIDLGTNTFHLIIADIPASGGTISVIYKTNVPVRLGQGRINEHMIIPEAFERGIQTLKDFRAKIVWYQAEKVRAIATSAVRSAVNGQEFAAAAAQEGIDIEVISGDEEAGYIYQGVKASGAIRGTSLIMDIGGGSTEFIICNEAQLIWKKSYDIGAARLMQAYFKSDPISMEEQMKIRIHLDGVLTDLKEACSIYRPDRLIGSAGAFETFATLLDTGLKPDEVVTTELDLQAYAPLASRLIRSTHQERADMKGLIPLRVDMIVIAAILTDYVLEMIRPKSLHLSTYDLKMGVLYSFR